MSSDLPFKVEYSKSGRAKCKGCQLPIEKDVVRLAAMVQSAFHDGKQPNWFHFQCFWRKQRPASEGDIDGFSKLRYDDQKKIREELSQLSDAVVAPAANGKAKKGKKRAAEEGSTSSLVLKDYGVEYAASGRAMCRGCEIKILKDEVRIKKIVYDTEVGMKYGGEPLWHHIDCFVKLRTELGFYESGDKLPGFKALTKEDQKKLKASLPVSTEVPVKKVKKEETDEVDSAKNKETEKLIEQQSKALFKLRDRLKDNLSKNELTAILEKNNQVVPEGVDNILDLVADIMIFGSLFRCPKCSQGQFVFTNVGYKCTGNLTDWVKCENIVKEPVRLKTELPKKMKETYGFLKKYKSVVSQRALQYIPPSGRQYAQSGPSLKLQKETEGPKVQKDRPPLYQMEFVILGNTKVDKDQIKERIRLLGGKVVTKIHDRTMAIISNEHEVERMGARMEQAKEFQIQVITDDFVKEMEKKKGGACEYIQSKSICDWGTDPQTRAKTDDELKSKSKSLYTRSVPAKVNLKLKGGSAVDPDSGLDDMAHVYKDGKNVYNAVLGLTDIQSGKNSYYKLQILEADKGSRYWVFRSWGRIGTTIGGNKVDDCSSLYDAMNIFKTLYEEKSGNMWDYRHDFQKVPGRMYPIDIDYGADEQVKKLDTTSSIKSSLPTPVQNLIKLIFDVDAMKKTMMEFELDMEKMPLGRLSKDQLKKAYAVLSELSEFITRGASNEHFIDASNRFFTLVPHSFGTELPPILDTLEVIKSKIDMLDSLMEIELAYSMLNTDVNDEKNPIDGHYEQLKTELVPMDKTSEDFKLLSDYVQNTHAETHNKYKLIVDEIFTVNRTGETKRYKPFRKLPNRKLLWHGSRMTNFAGILSHGLKIAPPEAPATGYMFGKGIYFADMVSKSANYCFTSPQNNTGLLLLCEVALGKMQEFMRAHYVEKVAGGCHSVKGIGQTFPNPTEAHVRKDGVEIPLGKPTKDAKIKSDLLYNEYIVYDIAQVNCQYLLKLKFDYKY